MNIRLLLTKNDDLIDIGEDNLVINHCLFIYSNKYLLINLILITI